jgi:hypothetical protein
MSIGAAMAWSAKFNHPIKWGARTLRTLHDARDYILKLPNSKQMLPAWQAAKAASALDREAWLKAAEEWIKLAQSSEQRSAQPK